jgi:hypothetical protein
LTFTANKPDQNNEDKKKKNKNKKHTRKPRARAGNKAKPRTPDRTETATVDECDLCGKDLRDKQALKSRNERLIEDISDPVEETEVIKIIQEKNTVMIAKKLSRRNRTWRCRARILGSMRAY